MENKTKYQCPDCGSVISNTPASIRNHNKTIKHLKAIGGDPDKEKLDLEKIRSRVNRSVKKDINREEYLRIQREKKRAYRARVKAKTKEEAKVEAKEEVKVIPEIKIDMDDYDDCEKICEEILKQVEQISENSDLNKQEVKEIVNKFTSNTIIKKKIDQQVDEDIDQLIERMDKKYLTKKGIGDIDNKTLVQYTKKIKNIFQDMKGKTWTGQLQFLKKPNKVIEYLENKYSNQNTLKAYYTGIVGILNRLNGFEKSLKLYQKQMMKHLKESNKIQSENKLSEKEEKNYMKWKDILAFQDKSWTYEDRFLFNLYTCIPPRRLEDYMLLKFVKIKKLKQLDNLDKNYNYLVSNKQGLQKLVLNKYKTHKKYKQFVINLRKPDELPIFQFKKLLKSAESFVKNTGIKSGELCFPDVKGEVKSVYKDMNYRLTYVFRKTKKNISVNILRHSFISHYTNSKNVSLKTLKKLSNYLGHSILTLLSYRKFDDVDDLIEKAKNLDDN